jgi:hypothetical protein
LWQAQHASQQQAAARHVMQYLLRHGSLADPEVVVVALAGLARRAAVTYSSSTRQQSLQKQKQHVL